MSYLPGTILNSAKFIYKHSHPGLQAVRFPEEKNVHDQPSIILHFLPREDVSVYSSVSSYQTACRAAPLCHLARLLPARCGPRGSETADYAAYTLLGILVRRGEARPDLWKRKRHGGRVGLPYEAVSQFSITIHTEGHAIPAANLARSISVRPEAVTILYVGDTFSIRETFFVPLDESGALIQFDVETEKPLELEASFQKDFQLEWPAAIASLNFNPPSVRAPKYSASN